MLRNNSTQSEIQFWQKVKSKNFFGYQFIRQKPLLNFIVDFYCYDLKLVVELDGYSHQFEKVRKKDVLKQAALENVGLTVLRYSDKDIMNNMEKVLFSLEGYVRLFEEEKTHP